MFVDVWLTNAELFQALLRRRSWCRASLSSKVLAVHFASELQATAAEAERIYKEREREEEREAEELFWILESENDSDLETSGP